MTGKRHFLTEAFFPSNLLDSRKLAFPTTGTFDGDVATEVNAEMLVAVTQDNPNTWIVTGKHASVKK